MKHNQKPKYLVILIVIFLIITSLPLAACGNDQKTYTIGVINIIPALDDTVTGFKAGMAELGYVEGENITYIYEGATNRIDKLDAVAQGLVAAEVDLILSISTPATQAVKRATADTDLPVVFVPVTDPVGAGLVASLRQPGGNITGVTFGVQEARRLDWLVQVAPTIEQIYVPYNPEDQSPVLALKVVSEAATTLGVKLIKHEARTQEEVVVAIENIPEQADAVFMLPDSLMTTHVTDLIDAANDLQLPTSGVTPDAVRDGALIAYGYDLSNAGKQAARLADQIFRGVKPVDLPVETAEFYLAINLKTAETIGLDIPDSILQQADIIIR